MTKRIFDSTGRSARALALVVFGGLLILTAPGGQAVSAVGDTVTSVKFTVYNNCATNSTFTFSIDGTVVGQAASPNTACDCGNPGPPTVLTITDANTLAQFASLDSQSCSTFTFAHAGSDWYSQYILSERVDITRSQSGTETLCVVDFTGKKCADLSAGFNWCSAGYRWESPEQPRTTGLPDEDGDGIPSCTDPDADGDGIQNEADNCPNSPGRIAFEKPNGAGTDVFDEITPNLKITRNSNGGLINLGSDSVQWARGTCAAPTSAFYGSHSSLLQNTRTQGNDSELPGSSTCLWDTTTNVKYDIRFVSWSCCNQGGFAYERVGVANPDQTDSDGNGRGDICDPVDRDADGVWNVNDNCPDAANPGQEDSDGNGTGDACQPNVVAVPWAGRPSNPHVVYSGGSLVLQAVASLGITGESVQLASGTWDPGDGSGPQAINVSNSRVLELVHTYAGSPGQPFTATITVRDTAGNTYSDTFRVQVQQKTLDVEVNMAIDKGLWNLHKSMTLGKVGSVTTGNWSSNNAVAATATAAQAFQINGHREIGNPLEDPYVDNVARALRYLQNNVSRLNIGTQNYSDGTTGDPDSNGNGYGLRTIQGSEIYVGGQIVDAFVASGKPNSVAVVGPEAGRRYIDIVADLMDAYSWGQDDRDGDRGGWVYNFNNNDGIDSSSSQWWAIGAHAADVWDPAMTPAFVRDQNRITGMAALQDYSLNAHAPGTGNHGGCSYRGGWSDSNNARTASCLVMMSANGLFKNSARWQAAEAFLARHFSSGYELHGDVYDMFALTKAMRLAKNAAGQPEAIELLNGTIDWYRADPFPNTPSDRRNGLARYLVGTQQADGTFPSHGHINTGQYSTAASIVILSPTLFELAPIASCSADPLIDGTAALGGQVTFDGSGSSHQDPDYAGVLTYAWNYQDGNTASGVSASHAFSNVGIYNVTLTVTDDKGLTNTTSCPVDVRDNDIPPNANIVVQATAPICAGDTVTFDGSSSSDLDNAIVLYEWDTTNPINFSTVDHVGTSVQVTYAAAGTYSVGLRVTDNDGSNGGTDHTDSAFATVTVIAANDPSCNQPPTANDDVVVTDEDVAVTFNVVDNDRDPNNNLDPATAAATSTTSNGTLVANGGGSFTYTPNANYHGPDGFAYTVCDTKAACASANVRITVNPVNDPPVAVDDVATTDEDTPVSGNVLPNDSDVDGDTLTVTLVTPPTNGMVAITANGAFTYTPDLNFNGSDSFTYVANDGSADSNVATVRITVIPVNDAPVAVDDAATTNEDTPVSGNVLPNDSDVDGDALTAALVSGPSNGGLVLNANGSFTYTPNLNFNGSDSFTYQVSDGALTSNVATVRITVISVNDAPVCEATPSEGLLWPPNHKLVSIGINGVSDVDGDTVSLRVTSITQDEPTNTVGDGNTPSDAAGIGTSNPQVRAERSGNNKVPGNGRVYHINFTGDDGNGGSCSGRVTVGVPHDQGQRRVPIDDGPLYNAVTGAKLP